VLHDAATVVTHTVFHKILWYLVGVYHNILGYVWITLSTKNDTKTGRFKPCL
jgi:hypothetical protein